MKKTIICLAVFFTCLSAAVYSQTKPTTKSVTSAKSDALTNKSITDMYKAGLDNEIILTKIAQSKCAFDLSTDGLIDLKSKGVPSDIIKAMMNKSDAKSATTSDKPAEKTTTSTTSSVTSTKKSGSLQLDLLNYVYAYSKSGQSAKALEKSVAGIRTKQGMFGGSAMLQVDGGKSTIQLGESDAGSFAINTGSAALPELVLYKVKSVKNKREVASMKVNTFTGVKTGEDVISLNISKLSDGVFEITPAKKLEKGEYFFTAKPVAGATSVDAYAFGVE